MVPFVGPSYQLATRRASVQRSVNLFLVGMEAPAKTPLILQSVPGLAAFANPAAEIRGIYEARGRCFLVAGNQLIELDSVGNRTVRGALGTNTGYVDFAWGTSQLVIVDGPNGYVFNLNTNTLTPITADGWLGSNRVAYLDGYFIFVDPDTQRFYVSAIDDASQIDALDFASAESSPDDIVSHIISHRELWLLGEQSTEVWFNAGGTDFPFARNNGAVLDIGCVASYSAQLIDNGLMWIARDRLGYGMVVRTNGYQPERVSTIAVEEALQSSTDLSQARAYVYQQDGQTFYCINAPGLASTWCYEASTGAWHERCDLVAGNLTAHRATCHAFVFGKHLVGGSGKVYRMDKTLSTFDGDIIKRMRISPSYAVPQVDRVAFNEFVLSCVSGFGPQGLAPVAELSWSDNGGITYGNPVQRSIGAVGNFLTRVVWNRLGMARDRVWKLEVTDAVPFSIIDAAVR